MRKKGNCPINPLADYQVAQFYKQIKKKVAFDPKQRRLYVREKKRDEKAKKLELEIRTDYWLRRK